jgi:hypothetical protein
MKNLGRQILFHTIFFSEYKDRSEKRMSQNRKVLFLPMEYLHLRLYDKMRPYFDLQQTLSTE